MLPLHHPCEYLYEFYMCKMFKSHMLSRSKEIYLPVASKAPSTRKVMYKGRSEGRNG